MKEILETTMSEDKATKIVSFLNGFSVRQSVVSDSPRYRAAGAVKKYIIFQFFSFGDFLKISKANTTYSSNKVVVIKSKVK